MELHPLVALRSAQLGALSSAIDVELGSATNVLLADESILAGTVWAAMSADGKRLAFTTPLLDRDTATRWVTSLEADVSSNRSLSRLLASNATGDCELEVRTTANAGADVTVRIMGPRVAEDDIASAVTLGFPDAICTELHELIDKILPTHGGLGGFAVRTGDSGHELEIGRVVADHADTIKEIAALAERVGVTKPQIALLPTIHPLLARGRGASVTLCATPKRVSQQIAIRYAAPPLDLIIQLADGLYRGDTAKKLGTFAGATASDDVAWVDLVLGPAEPPALWIAVAMSHRYGAVGENQRA